MKNEDSWRSRMPTYACGLRMTDERAAEILRNAFPRCLARVFHRGGPAASVHMICDALIHARIKCKSENLAKCLRWAYAKK